MANSYSVQAILSATDKNFSSTLKNALGVVNKLGTKVGGFAFGALAGAGSAAFNAVTRSASELVGEINSSNKAWKTFDGNMKILGKSEAEINSVKKSLQSFAQESIYSSSDMASTYAQLAAVGTKSADKLVTGFGGLAAAAENPSQAMKTLSQQAVQMAAKPNVAWADFKLMLEQTPAGIAAVAKEMGMSTSEMVTAIQDGKVKTEDFFEAINKVGNSDSFQKLATSYKSVDEAMDGLKETLGNKLTPAFDVLSKVGIKAIEGIMGKLDSIDAEALAKKVSTMVNRAGHYLDILKTTFDGVGTQVWNALKAVGDALGLTNKSFSHTQAIVKFKGVCQTVADAIAKVANFIERNADAIAKIAPIIGGLVGAFAALKVVDSVAPGLTNFAGSLAKMAGKGIAGLAAKLFGISIGQKAVGSASVTTAAGVMKSAMATLALGAAVALAAVGLALLVQSAIALANAGWPAVAALVGLVGVIALLAIGAAAIGPALTAGAVGLVAFGAAIALVGVGAILAAASLAIISAVLPSIAANGLQGAIAIAQLGLAMTVFAVGAALAGAACIVLGAGLILIGTAILIAGAGMLLLATAALVAAGAVALLSVALPTIATYGSQAAVAMVELGIGLTAFAAGAAVAGAAAIVLGAGILVCAAGLTVAAAAALILGTSVMMIGTGAMMAAAGLAVVGAVLPVISKGGAKSAAALLLLGGGLAAFFGPALAAGAAAAALGAGFLVATAGATTLAASCTLLGAGAMIASVGILMLSGVLPVLIANSTGCLEAFTTLAAGMTAIAGPAAIAGAAAAVLGAGMLVAASSSMALMVAVAALATGLAATGAAMMVCAANTNNLVAAMNSLSSLIVAVGSSSMAAASGVLSFGTAMALAFASTKKAAITLRGIADDMKAVAGSSHEANLALAGMIVTLNAIALALTSLGNTAQLVMLQIQTAFDSTATAALGSGQMTGQNYATGLQSKIPQVSGVARQMTSTAVNTLRSAYGQFFSVGAYLGEGLVQGLLSKLAAVQAAAAQLASAAAAALAAAAGVASPSKITIAIGEYVGEGLAIGMSDMKRDVLKAAQDLVNIPAAATPNIAMGYSGEMSADYDYYRNAEYVIVVPLNLDGREVGKATARYTQEEIDRQQTRDSRKRGKV